MLKIQLSLDNLKEWINKFQTTRHTQQQQGLQPFDLDLEISKHLVQQGPIIQGGQIQQMKQDYKGRF